MRCILKNAKVFLLRAYFIWRMCFFLDGKIVSIGNGVSVPMILLLLIFPIWFYFPVSLMSHVHLREPGFSLKRETIRHRHRWSPRTAASPTLPPCRT